MADGIADTRLSTCLLVPPRPSQVDGSIAKAATKAYESLIGGQNTSKGLDVHSKDLFKD